MEQALDDAGLTPGRLGQINAHGTSTPQQRRGRGRGHRQGVRRAGIPVTSIKGVTGHLVGAAGSLEAIAAVLAARTGQVPPTANHHSTDLPVDVVVGEPRTIAPAPALSTSFAFGGHNAALVVGPAPGATGP